MFYKFEQGAKMGFIWTIVIPSFHSCQLEHYQHNYPTINRKTIMQFEFTLISVQTDFSLTSNTTIFLKFDRKSNCV